MGNVQKDAALYLDEDGEYLPIGADEVWKIHCSPNGEDRKQRIYYSLHPGDEKIRMSHCHNENNTNWFAYVSGQESKINSLGGSESLCHYLVKKAFLEISESTLELKHTGDSSAIKLLESSDEFRVDYNSNKFYIDVYSSFTSDNRLALKWGGKIGIEVHHKHPVPGEKKEALRELEIPIVEYKIPRFIVERAPKDIASNKLVNRHFINFVKPYLSDTIGVTVLSDPSSKEYLTVVNEELVKQVDKLKNEKNQLKNKNDELNYEIYATNNELESTRSQLQSTHNIQKHESSMNREIILELESKLSNYRNISVFRFVLSRYFRSLS